MTEKEIYQHIYPCICGSKEFRPMIGYLINTIEIVCAKCGRTANYKGNYKE